MGLLDNILGRRATEEDHDERIAKFVIQRDNKNLMADKCEARATEEFIRTSHTNSAKEAEGYRNEARRIDKVIGELLSERDALRARKAGKDEAALWEIADARAQAFEQKAIHYQESCDQLAAEGRELEAEARALVQSAPHIRADFDRGAFVLNLPTLARDRLDGRERNPVNGNLARTIVEVAKEFTAMVLALKPKATSPEEASTDSQPTESAPSNL